MTRIEAERKRRGWTQTELAFFAQMHQPDVSRIERGIQKPTADRRQRLSRVLGVPPDRLLDEVELRDEAQTVAQ